MLRTGVYDLFGTEYLIVNPPKGGRWADEWLASPCSAADGLARSSTGDRVAGRQQGHSFGGGVDTDSQGRTGAGKESIPTAPRWDATPLWQHALAAAVIGPVLWWALGPGAAARFTAAVAVSAGAQAAFVAHLRGRLGAVVPSPADAVTLVRATSGATLLALVACGERDGAGPSRRIAFALLLGAVASDWVDGSLARRDGPSRLGAVLDIEADSLLTLGGAAAATAWGGLPRIALLPPALRYLDPVLALCRGEDPSGGGPWWCRASGAAQMALFLAALRPGPCRAGRWRQPAALAVFIAQLTTQVLDGRRRNPRSPSSRVAGCRSPASVLSLACQCAAECGLPAGFATRS
jgi:phosphatidylglycerophosphate synthase